MDSEAQENNFISTVKAVCDLEDVIDTLCQVGNGVTDKHLHEAADKLFIFRDEHYLKLIPSTLNQFVKQGIIEDYEIKEGKIYISPTEYSDVCIIDLNKLV